MTDLATVVSPMIEPDEEAIKAHLDQLCEPARWDYPDGLVEICHGPATAPLSQAALFPVSEEGVDEAVKYAVSVNRRGENTYVGVNPRKRGTNPGKRASGRDVEISFFHFADLDDREAVERARAGLPLRPTMIVMTGTEPHNRPHFYWRLSEPVMNLEAWTERQSGIAQSLGGDAVIDPPRVMRLAGTVNFPLQHKIERGYRVELTTIRTSFASERPFVTPEQVATAFPLRPQPYDTSVELPGGQTTLAAMRGTRIADLLAACRSGTEWHNNMVRLVAHLAAVGRSNAEIVGLAAGITLPGYTVDQTERDMAAALDGARRKWSLPEPADTVETEEAAREPADSVFELLDLDQLESLPPPSWLIDGLIVDHGLSIAYGDPGAGKSFIVLDMALRLAFGMDWHGLATIRCGVLYVAGEGSRGFGKRVKGWRREHGLEGADAPFLLLPVAVQMLDVKEREKLCRTIDAACARAGFPIGLVVIDTVSRSIAGQDENGQESMSNFVAGCAQIQRHTGGAVIGVHHAGKDGSRGMRGSSVLLGGCDAALKITKDEAQRATIEVEKQKDAEEIAPICMKLKKVEWAVGLGKEESTLVPIISEALEPRPENRLISRSQIGKTFDEIDSAWMKKKPWSVAPNTRSSGRYLPAWMASEFGIKESQASEFLSAWLMRDYLSMEVYDTHSKGKGLRVLRRLEDWK